MDTRYDGSDADVPDRAVFDSPNGAAHQFDKLSAMPAWLETRTPFTPALAETSISDFETEEVTVRISASFPQMFVRLRVTRP